MEGRALTAVELELLAGIACLWRRYLAASPSPGETIPSAHFGEHFATRNRAQARKRPPAGDTTMGLCGKPGPATITSPATWCRFGRWKSSRPSHLLPWERAGIGCGGYVGSRDQHAKRDRRQPRVPRSCLSLTL